MACHSYGIWLEVFHVLCLTLVVGRLEWYSDSRTKLTTNRLNSDTQPYYARDDHILVEKIAFSNFWFPYHLSFCLKNPPFHLCASYVTNCPYLSSLCFGYPHLFGSRRELSQFFLACPSVVHFFSFPFPGSLPPCAGMWRGFIRSPGRRIADFFAVEVLTAHSRLKLQSEKL